MNHTFELTGENSDLFKIVDVKITEVYFMLEI